MRLLLELPASGGVLPSYRFNTYNLMRYYGSFGNVLIILEGILVGFIVSFNMIIFYIFEKILELIRLRLRYFGKFWDIVDIVLLTLCSCEVFFNYRRLTIAANRINTSLKSGLTVAAFDEVVSTQETFNNIAAVVLFLSWIKTMNQLAETLSRSAKDIGGFAVMFAVFFFAYAQFGYLVFGTQIADYSTFLDSVFALLRTVLGDFDFTALQQTNRVLGPLFFVTYVFFVFFVLLNMFLAIINDSYTEVKAELARQKEGYGVFDWIRMKLTRGKKEDKKFTTYNDYKIDLMMAGYNEKDITDALDKCNVGLDDEVNDEVLVELGNEIRDQVQRKKLIDEEYRSTAVLTHRIDMMDNAIFNVVEKLSKTIEQLNRIEYSKVLVKEHQNQLKADEILFNARLEDGLAEDVEDNKED
ncbi:unnamed protein product [Haemonchus placei]|uniref:Polycystin cation channel PKD1/PKD2 domain-containing protein n=1 Tax=Haemonchus placei TaxID=6290 RepID=A0A3P7V280_HAEPC|nr:unnamed protein product [Haemonchus placei]